jgi:hypothetical protein
MNYIGTENYEGSKQPEEKTLIFAKKANLNEVDLEMLTQSQDFKSSYKMKLQMSNMIVIKRLVDVGFSQAVQSPVPFGLELPYRFEQR